MFDLSEGDKKFAEENLNETKIIREHCLSEIKKWLQEENQNLHARLEDVYLLPFLRGCKFDLEKTKKKLKNYYAMRRDIPEWFENRDPQLDTMQELIKLGIFVPLRKTHKNMLVVIIRVAAHNPLLHKQDDVFKAGNMMLDVASMENVISAQIYGVVSIFDMAGISSNHGKQMTPGMIKKAVFSWQNYHCKPKQLEFINAPVFIGVVLNIFKSFMSKKMRDRVRVHFNGIESLYEAVDKDILPVDYGGNGETMSELIKYWNTKFLSYRDWFLNDEQFKAE
ncbi:retinol-binding protein pinta [Leptinotarsa decemlineata]|uniref:retinol-binding protein pinta n=1 Tax=Leptinotarsa decemlineata TaxID=7539 RepID=UPI000C2524B7|nr:retinol-binding protein pinta-like [Leptinotarsa decemlineata]